MRKKILVGFGTRPEAIKLCPLIKELEKRERLDTVVYVSGQHRELLDGALARFGVTARYDGNIMKSSQSLFDVTVDALDDSRGVLEREKPDAVIVHGDTTTAFALSLACFYLSVPVYHVEAGLRTYDVSSPFPEEFNRRAISLVASYHFAPTARARDNLLEEGVLCSRVSVTGNTVIDAVKLTEGMKISFPLSEKAVADGEKLIFLTAHRRENADILEKMLNAVGRVAREREDVRFIYPVHPSERVRETARRILGQTERVSLIPPLDVAECHGALRASYMALTDSGGIQEEAAALGVPVLIMRNTTERPEGIRAGVAKLVGTDGEGIYRAINGLLDSPKERQLMSAARKKNPYGDGNACVRIADAVEKLLLNK